MSKVSALVYEKSKVVGTGNAVLIPVNGYRRFITAFPGSSEELVFHYIMRHSTTGDYEEGLSYLNEDGELVRDVDTEIFSSSNNGELVNFAAGVKELVCDLPAAIQERVINLDSIIGAAIDDQVNPTNPRIAINGTFPDRTLSFDNVLTAMNMNKILDHKFGTNAPPAGATKIGDTTALGQWYMPLEYVDNAVVINNELQRYPTDFVSYPNTLKWNPDEVELNTYIHSGAPILYTTKPSQNYTYSRTVNVLDASNARIGAVVGLGNEAYDNMHTMRSHSIKTAGVGDVYTYTLTSKLPVNDGGFAGTVTITSFTSAGNDENALAQDIVDKINANTTLQQYKITAYKMPYVVGGWVLTWPRLSDQVTAEFGDGTSKGNLGWLTLTWTRTGTGTINAPQLVQGVNYIVAKSGNTLTLSHPIKVTTDSVLTFNPTRMFECDQTGGVTVYNVPDANGVTTGMVGQFAYQDNTPRRISAVDTVSGQNTITFETATYMQAAHWITLYDMYKAYNSGSVSNSTSITLQNQTLGLRPGMIIVNYYVSPGMYHNDVARIVSTDGTSVTLDRPITLANGSTLIFMPFYVSGQFWSKYRLMPSLDNNTIIALQLQAKFPAADKIAGWPAWWLFYDSSDPNPNPNPYPAASAEIDMVDTFNYWNNPNANALIMNAPSGSTTLESKPYTNGSNFVYNNNLGIKERKIQMVWTRDRVYFYVEGILIFARRGIMANSKRANMGINLAHGSMSSGFMSTGFYPMDFSMYPITFKVKQLKIWASPNATPITV